MLEMLGFLCYDEIQKEGLLSTIIYIFRFWDSWNRNRTGTAILATRTGEPELDGTKRFQNHKNLTRYSSGNLLKGFGTGTGTKQFRFRF